VPTAFGPVEFMPGVRLVIVEDPDGNWVEFVHRAPEQPREAAEPPSSDR
jgi:hypothetical protein